MNHANPSEVRLDQYITLDLKWKEASLRVIVDFLITQRQHFMVKVLRLQTLNLAGC